MRYTQIHPDIKLELNRLKKEPYSIDNSFKHPTSFAIHELKITPYTYQHLILRKFAEGVEQINSRTIICKSRQIGLSICLAMLAIWYAGFNKANGGKGTGIHNNTKVGIISKTDPQAKKLMKEIQNMVWNSGHSFPTMVRREKGVSLNKSEIHFKHGWIKSYPPTDASRGETFDLLIIDEAAFVDGDNFKDAMEPTVSAVGGKIILSSTPKGQSGFYFELFDPYNILPEHEYERFWFWWDMCENPMQRRVILDKKKHAKLTGNYKSFEQEYNAKFTVDEEAFFEDHDVEKGVDPELSPLYEYHDGPCSIGIDYGGVDAATCITVIRKNKDKLEMIYQFAKSDFDFNLLNDPDWEHSIQNLTKRYQIQQFVVDDCAAGTQTNQWLENEGYPLYKFDFRTDAHRGSRTRGYYVFRNFLKRGLVKYFNDSNLKAEMKYVQEVRQNVNTRIKAPRNYRDDRIDSLMMACYPFLISEGDFSSMLVEYDNVKDKLNQEKRNHDGRADLEWGKHKTR